MNAWTIYWILQLDTVVDALTVAASMSGMAAGGLYLFSAMHKAEDSYSWNEPKAGDRATFRALLLKRAKPVAIVACLLAVAVTLLPTSKTAAAMVIVPAIANNETIRKESGELYDLAKQALRDAVTDKAKDAAKEVAK